MPEAPLFSLIVCTLGRRDVLVRLFQSLQVQSCSDFEVVLVDQNPQGYLDAILTAHADGLRVAHVSSAKGLSRARNVGLAVARGTFIAFPDDDCWYPPDVLSAVKDWFAGRPDVGVLTCPTRDASGVLSNGRYLGASGFVERREVWFAGNSNGLFFRRSVTSCVGGFDETLGVGAGTPFGAGEETDYLLRALKTGVKIWFEKALFVHHDQVGQCLDASELARARLYARGFGRVLRLHNYSVFYALYRAGRSLGAAVKAFLSGNMVFCRFKLIWVVGTLAGYVAPVYDNRLKPSE